MPNGCRSWITWITIRGVRHDISLEPLATLALAEARDKAHGIRKTALTAPNEKLTALFPCAVLRAA